MPYRDEEGALEARRDALREELSAVEGRLASRRLPLLDAVRVARPCKQSWHAMAGDDRVRFCHHCAKQVYNLSAMTGEEAEKVLREREGSLCVQLFRRADGTVVTADCPAPARRPWVLATVGAGALVAAGAAAIPAHAPRAPRVDSEPGGVLGRVEAQYDQQYVLTQSLGAMAEPEHEPEPWEQAGHGSAVAPRAGAEGGLRRPGGASGVSGLHLNGERAGRPGAPRR